MSRLALGTVQFGLAYGVANTTGQVSDADAEAILFQARAAGIDTLDTAVAYGDSERRLGALGVQGWRIVTKLPPMPPGTAEPRAWVTQNADESLTRLRTDRLSGLLLHRPLQLLETGGDALYEGLAALKAQGLVERIGVSVYGPEELDAIWSRFPVDLVQAPFNVVDRRMESTGWLRRLKQSGVEVHTRSAFLQGLLLMTAATRPAYFGRWQEVWERWDGWHESTAQRPIETALRYVLENPQVDRVVVGVDRAAQLREIIEVGSKPGVGVPDGVASTDADLVNPARWRVE